VVLSVSRDGAELIGYLAGAFVASLAGVTVLGYAVTGWTLAFVVDAVSYVLSAVLLLGLPRVMAGAAPEAEKGVVREAPRLRTLIAESPKVMAVLWRRPVLRTNLLLAVFAMGAVMMNVPNSFMLAQDVFGRGSLGLGALEVFVAVGLIAGGLVVSRLRLAGDKNGYVLLSLMGMSVCYVAVGFCPWFWASLVLMGLAGAADVGAVVASITMYQEIPASLDKGRLIALRSSSAQMGVAAGFVVGGLVGEVIGIKHAFMVTGAAAVAIGLAIYLPYRAGASRRRRQAWTAAAQAGARRSHALELSRRAAFSGLASAGGGLSGPGIGTTGWAAAEAAEANAGSES
jgi:MFS family permease